jgi:hypothetical protein
MFGSAAAVPAGNEPDSNEPPEGTGGRLIDPGNAAPLDPLGRSWVPGTP